MRLTKKEWKTIEFLHFKEDYTMREISKLYPVSRVALYDHFRNLKRSRKNACSIFPFCRFTMSSLEASLGSIGFCAINSGGSL